MEIFSLPELAVVRKPSDIAEEMDYIERLYRPIYTSDIYAEHGHIVLITGLSWIHIRGKRVCLLKSSNLTESEVNKIGDDIFKKTGNKVYKYNIVTRELWFRSEWLENYAHEGIIDHSDFDVEET